MRQEKTEIMMFLNRLIGKKNLLAVLNTRSTPYLTRTFLWKKFKSNDYSFINESVTIRPLLPMKENLASKIKDSLQYEAGLLYAC